MDEDRYDKIVADRKLPSHDWAKKNVGRLDAVMEVADAERSLVEAIDIRNERAGSSVAWQRESGENRLNTALFNLASVYLTHGVAADEETALSQAKRAMRTMNHCLNHDSVTQSR